MKIIGAVLVIVGVLGLVYGGITYNRNRTVLQMGSMKVTASEQKSFPISGIAGAIALLGGVGLLVVGNRRS